jgi:hypothetical protein
MQLPATSNAFSIEAGMRRIDAYNFKRFRRWNTAWTQASFEGYLAAHQRTFPLR